MVVDVMGVDLKTKLMIICCSAISFIAAAPPVNFTDLRDQFNTFVAQAQNGVLSQVERINALNGAQGIIDRLRYLKTSDYFLSCFEGFGFNGVAVDARSYGRITESLVEIARELEAYRRTIVPQVAAAPMRVSAAVAIAAAERWREVAGQQQEITRRLMEQISRLRHK